MSTKKTSVIVVMLIVAAAIALIAFNWPQRFANAQQSSDPPGQTEPRVEFSAVALTEAEWNDINPRPAFYGGSSSDALRYDEEDLSRVEAGIKLTWSFSELKDVSGVVYKLERQLQEPDGPENGWRLIAARHPTNTYKDPDGAPGPGFGYKYRITPTGVGVPRVKPYTTDEEIHLIPRDGFYGFGHEAAKVKLHIVPIKRFEQYRAYRVTRYKGPLDTAGKLVTDNTIDQEVTDKVPESGEFPALYPGKVYRYKLDVGVLNSEGKFEFRKTIGSIYVKAGAPTFGDKVERTQPEDAERGGGEAGVDLTVQWDDPDPEMPGGLHRSQFALYEVGRRVAKQWDARFDIIGSAAETNSLKEEPASGDEEHFEYAVRAVSWTHEHGMYATFVSPTLPQPKCSVDGFTEKKEVYSISLNRIETQVPANKRYGFFPAAWAVGDVAHTGTTITYPDCAGLDTSDWYVERAVVLHLTPEACAAPNADCLAMTHKSASDVKDSELEHVKGQFFPQVGSKPIWYDDPPKPELEPKDKRRGLYKYAYRMCSYATKPKQVCSNNFLSDWRFEGDDPIVALPE